MRLTMDAPYAISQALQTSPEPASSDAIFGMTMGGLAAGLIFSGLGLIYVKYGKSTGNITMIVSGVLLLGYPYFFSDTTQLVLIGAFLAAFPHLAAKYLSR